MVVEMVAVPEHVAVPSDSLAVVGADNAPVPPAVMVSGVPLAIALLSVKATVAVASLTPLLKLVKVQV
jgi:hypothetical protein